MKTRVEVSDFVVMWEQVCRKDLRIDHLIPSMVQSGSAS